MDALTAPLSAALNAFFPKSPKSAIALHDDVEEKLNPDGEPTTRKVEFRVEGMTCGACVEVGGVSNLYLELC